MSQATPKQERHRRNGPFEIRLNDDGTIDEVLLYIGNQCVMHLEQMDDGYFWMGLYADAKTCHVNVGARKGDAFINAEWWDDEGDGGADSFGFDEQPATEG